MHGHVVARLQLCVAHLLVEAGLSAADDVYVAAAVLDGGGEHHYLLLLDSGGGGALLPLPPPLSSTAASSAQESLCGPGSAPAPLLVVAGVGVDAKGGHGAAEVGQERGYHDHDGQEDGHDGAAAELGFVQGR